MGGGDKAGGIAVQMLENNTRQLFGGFYGRKSEAA